MLEHASAPPSPCTLCALSAQAIHAAQGQPGRERRGWYPLGQLEKELDLVARTGDQVVEVLHVMGGEDSPRRVLCPWRAHRLASTLPAVARATAVCFLRCECLRGRDVGRPRDPRPSRAAGVLNKHQSILPTPKVLCKHNSFGVVGSDPPTLLASQHAPL